jgi:hypothetical protein
MAYSRKSQKTGREYFLHSKEVELNGGYKQTIYYFAPQPGPDAIEALPDDHEIIENDRTGLPLLRRKK